MLSDKEVLQACITKAIEGGWTPFDNFNCTNVVVYDEPDGRAVLSGSYIDADGYRNPAKHYIEDVSHLIFNHDFAKALWGLKNITRPTFIDYMETKELFTTHLTQPNWQYHLQQLAVAEDRISYLRENA